jgi:hypothetical protein
MEVLNSDGSVLETNSNGRFTLLMPLLRRLLLFLLLLAAPCSLFADYGDTVSFSYQIGGAVPSPQFAGTIVSTTSIQISGLALRITQPWIQAWLSSGFTPSDLTVSVSPAGMAAGTYYGTVEVYSPRMSNTLDYTVSLTITNPPPPLSASPSSLAFNAVQGSAPPPSQTLVIGGNLSGGAMITSSSTTPSWLNAGWISVGTAPMSVPISINPSFTNLTPGTYTTSLLFEAPFSSQKVTVPITLNVTVPPPVLKTNLNQLQFPYVLGGSAPAAQTIQVTSSSSPLTASVSLNVPWLTASALTGTTPFATNIGVNPNGLAIGTYSGRVTVATSLGTASASSQSIDGH